MFVYMVHRMYFQDCQYCGKPDIHSSVLALFEDEQSAQAYVTHHCDTKDGWQISPYPVMPAKEQSE